jgi:hypothetical protein
MKINNNYNVKITFFEKGDTYFEKLKQIVKIIKDTTPPIKKEAC